MSLSVRGEALNSSTGRAGGRRLMLWGRTATQALRINQSLAGCA
jgi:hypothetical protein